MNAPINRESQMPQDSDRQPLQLPRGYTQEDGTGTPITSPVTVTSSVVTLVVPTENESGDPIKAVNVIVTPIGDAIRFAKVGALTGGTGNLYEVIPNGVPRSITVANGEDVLFLQNSGSVSLSFGYQYL